MNDLLSALIPSLAWALLDFVWQGLLVGWAAALALGLLRKARPQTRYALGCGALLLCAALPLAGTVQRLMDAQAVTTALLPLAVAPADLESVTSGGPVTLATGRLALWQHALQAQLPLVILVWACGAGLLALRMVLGLLWVRRRSQPGQSRADPVWQARASRLAAQFGIRRPVRLGLVDDLASPVTAGWWRPVVLLPASLASGMPPELLEALLAHEMAHIKRLDYLVNLFQSAIEILLFYHPAVWWLSNRVRLEREQIADDLAASLLGEPRRLALALSELDRFQFATPQLAHAAHGGNLMSRIKRLVRPGTEPLNWKMALPILGLAAACAAFYAHADSGPPPPVAPAPARAPVPPAPPLPSAAPLPPAPPLPSAAPLPPAAPVPPAKWKQTIERPVSRNGHGDAYVLVRRTANGVIMGGDNGDSGDWQQIEVLKGSVPGDFLWFRNAGKTYVVQDAGVLAKVIEAWAPLDRLGAEMDVYGKEMDKHGKAMAALGREMEAAAGQIEPPSIDTRQIEALARQQERLGRRMEKLGRKMENADRAERDKLQRERNQLHVKMHALSSQMQQQQEGMRKQHARMDSAQRPMEALGKKMEEAGKPMDALGKKMDVLGKEMDRESHAAEKVVRGLIQDALGNGVATPAPGRSAG